MAEKKSPPAEIDSGSNARGPHAHTSEPSIAQLIEALPQRFRGDASVGARARYRICVGRVVRDFVVTKEGCRVERATGACDVEVSTDAPTWRAIDAGRISGVEAFAERRLTVRGSIEKSLQFEPLFERPAAGALRYSIERIDLGGTALSVLSTDGDDREPLVLLHGLGATKASWLTVIPALARRYRVVALDLPGFGASSKPLGRYDAPWFADHVFGVLDAMGCERAFVAGNSMGGRIAMEMAMLRSERVQAIACLCPAAAFTRRPVAFLVRALRPELGLVAARLPRKRLKQLVKDFFADPSRLDEVWYEAALDDFLGTWRSPRARLAFFSAARHIYLDEPFGEGTGFWSRLALMKTPALYIYGRHDILITPRFASHVERALPAAEVVVWDDCGHVPQLEFPERTSSCVLDFFAGVTREDKVGRPSGG